MVKSKDLSRRLKIRLTITFLSMVISMVSLIMVSFSWFLYNRTADVNNPIVDVRGSFDVALTLYIDDVKQDQYMINFDNMYPGAANSRKLKIVMENLDDRPFLMSWFFKEPSALDEAPYHDVAGTYGTAGRYYYLGSQIQVSDIRIVNGETVYETAAGEGHYLVTTSSSEVGKGQNNGVASLISSFGRLDLTDDVYITASSTTTIDMDLTFVDNGVDQNVFQYAWPETGKCVRYLALYPKKAE